MNFADFLKHQIEAALKSPTSGNKKVQRIAELDGYSVCDGVVLQESRGRSRDEEAEFKLLNTWIKGVWKTKDAAEKIERLTERSTGEARKADAHAKILLAVNFIRLAPVEVLEAVAEAAKSDGADPIKVDSLISWRLTGDPQPSPEARARGMNFDEFSQTGGLAE